MAETALTITTPGNQWSTEGAAVTMDALDNANGNKFAAKRLALVIAHNTDASPHFVQITSQPLANTGRTGSVNEELAAGEIRAFLVTRDGWANAADEVLLPTGQSATIEVGIVDLTNF